jgi:hypothetical protein
MAKSKHRKESTSPPAPLRDGEGSRMMGGEELTDAVKDAVGMLQDQAVGQPENDKTRCGKPSIAAAVAQGLGEVRGTISFDDEARFFAEEVDEEGADGMLTAELGLPACRVAVAKAPARQAWKNVAEHAP